MLTTLRARAFVSHGRWVSVCPDANCNNAEEVHPWAGYVCGHRQCQSADRETTFVCSNCRLMAALEWPDNAQEIWAALLERPRWENRNWYPEDHELALLWNLPHGQSVNDLRVEHTRRCADD